MGKTSISWAASPDGTPGSSWNVMSGCSAALPCYERCYARRMAQRLRGRFGYPQDDPFAVTLHPDRLEEPLHLKKPQRIFVSSMGDLFHPRVPWEFILRVFLVMEATPQHTYMLLTKRVGRMAWWANNMNSLVRSRTWPANVWAGVSITEAKYLPWLDVLARVPAPARFVSLEPLLGDVNLTPWIGCEECHGNPDRDIVCGCGNVADPTNGADPRDIDWVVCGGETGPGARPMNPEWVRSIRDQCEEAGVPFHFKGWGEWFPRDQWEWQPELTLPDDDEAYQDGPNTKVFLDDAGVFPVHRVGRRAAGHLLDGVEHREVMP